MTLFWMPSATVPPAGSQTDPQVGATTAPASTMGPVAFDVQAKTAELLRQLFGYLERHVGAHPSLAPAIPALRVAVQLYGQHAMQPALNQGIAVYQYLLQARAAEPDLPTP